MRIAMMNDFQGRLRIATLSIAVVLGWFSLATIFAESLTPETRSLSLDPAARPDPKPDGLLAGWSAAAAPLRGDLLADAALARAIPVLRPDKTAASPEVLAARESALFSARQALSFAPHASGTWLLVAMLENVKSPQESVAEALKMSYLTSPADLSLIPARLALVAASTATADADLADLARRDIRLILTRRPDLKSAISSAYDGGSTGGRTFLYEVMRSLDPKFAATLR
jgi:hypothetical protein